MSRWYRGLSMLTSGVLLSSRSRTWKIRSIFIMIYTWFIAQRFKSHHCHVRTTVYSILLYHTLFSLQYRLPYYFEFFRFYDLHWSFEAAQFNLQFFNHHLYLKNENQFEPALSLLSHYCKLPIYQHPTAPFNVFVQRRFYLSSLSHFFLK